MAVLQRATVQKSEHVTPATPLDTVPESLESCSLGGMPLRREFRTAPIEDPTPEMGMGSRGAVLGF